MQEQEREYGIGRSLQTGLRDKNVKLLEDEQNFEEEVSDYSKIKLLNEETDMDNKKTEEEKQTYVQLKRAMRETKLMK